MAIDSKFFIKIGIMFVFLGPLRCKIMHLAAILMKMMAMTYFKIFYLKFFFTRGITFNIIAIKT